MQDFTIVAMLQGKANLCEVVKYLILSEILQHASLLLILVLILDLCLHVSIVGVIHDNTQLPLLSFIDLAETNDIWVAEDFQDLGFPERLLPLLIGHLLDINLLDDSELSI